MARRSQLKHPVGVDKANDPTDRPVQALKRKPMRILKSRMAATIDEPKDRFQRARRISQAVDTDKAASLFFVCFSFREIVRVFFKAGVRLAELFRDVFDDVVIPPES